jgi:hypothetical protein
VAQRPEIASWLEEMVLRKQWGFCPDDPLQRAFMLAMIQEDDKT